MRAVIADFFLRENRVGARELRHPRLGAHVVPLEIGFTDFGQRRDRFFDRAPQNQGNKIKQIGRVGTETRRCFRN